MKNLLIALGVCALLITIIGGSLIYEALRFLAWWRIAFG